MINVSVFSFRNSAVCEERKIVNLNNSDIRTLTTKSWISSILVLTGTNSSNYEKLHFFEYILINTVPGVDQHWIQPIKKIFWEFDPGSGWTLAACLRHASRSWTLPSGEAERGKRESNTLVTFLEVVHNPEKFGIIHNGKGGTQVIPF